MAGVPIAWHSSGSLLTCFGAMASTVVAEVCVAGAVSLSGSDGEMEIPGWASKRTAWSVCVFHVASGWPATWCHGNTVWVPSWCALRIWDRSFILRTIHGLPQDVQGSKMNGFLWSTQRGDLQEPKGWRVWHKKNYIFSLSSVLDTELQNLLWFPESWEW